MPRPTLQSGPAAPEKLSAQADWYFSFWRAPELIGTVKVSYSNRMRVTLGRACPERGYIHLNARLRELDPALIDEVVCHEAAHILVYHRYGRSARPHGAEWAALLRQAGYRPRTRMPIAVPGVASIRRRYAHRCPVCRTVRFAKRPVTNWRCATCIDAGLSGQLIIEAL